MVFPKLEQVTLCEVLAGQQILVRCAEVSDNHGVLIHVKTARNVRPRRVPKNAFRSS